MGEVIYRHWRRGDDPGVLRILEPMGWCTPEVYAGKFDDPGLRERDVLIAERDGVIVGHLMLPHRRMRFGQATLPFGGVGMVVVDPDTRGLGIGSTLLRRALAHHRAAGNALVGLYTMTTLAPAYEMYGRHGFQVVARRATPRLSPVALGPSAGLTARPAEEIDRPALARLLGGWAAEHAGVSVEAADAPLAGQRVVTRAGGEVVGRVTLADRPEGRSARGVLAAPGQPVAAVLAAGLTGEASDVLPVVVAVESRAYAELASLAAGEERDGSVLMFAGLGLKRVLAGLSVEVAGRLREAEVAPMRATLALAEADERVGVVWDGQVLTIADPVAGAPPIPVTGGDLALGLGGQPGPAPDPALAALWAAIFPARRADMGLVNCW